ncbi:hypothetical protein NQZ68_003107 [Dissostichus eleginoides]|nr:hypothetical protein NQZ68_003107 [Dissostichus eleginoides]
MLRVNAHSWRRQVKGAGGGLEAVQLSLLSPPPRCGYRDRNKRASCLWVTCSQSVFRTSQVTSLFAEANCCSSLNYIKATRPPSLPEL